MAGVGSVTLWCHGELKHTQTTFETSSSVPRVQDVQISALFQPGSRL